MTLANAKEIEKFICDTYGRNGFVHYCNIEIESIKCGEAILSFEVEDDKHTNIYGAAHGGVLGTLIDTSLGVVAASLGKRVVTLQLSTNYINSIYFFDKASARATVVHKGMTTMVIDVVVRNRKNEIVATGTGTMFVVGKFDEIPDNW
jgi:acyl-CoA thioesterase